MYFSQIGSHDTSRGANGIRQHGGENNNKSRLPSPTKPKQSISNSKDTSIPRYTPKQSTGPGVLDRNNVHSSTRAHGTYIRDTSADTQTINSNRETQSATNKDRVDADIDKSESGSTHL